MNREERLKAWAHRVLHPYSEVSWKDENEISLLKIFMPKYKMLGQFFLN